MRLGKKPARLDRYKLRLSDYLVESKLPPVPPTFGHYGLVSNYGVLANDSVGDCVIAGALHETQIWNATQARTVPVSDACAIANYSAITGYDPTQTDSNGNNPTDQGADVGEAARWRIAHGITDAAGRVHKIAAFVFVNPHNLIELRTAAYLFGAVGLGFDLPDSAEEQFAHSMAWTPVPGARSLGGHYVPLVGWNSGFGIGITWGERQAISPGFIRDYADEAIAYLTAEDLNRHQKSPEGVDLAALRADLVALEAHQ
jgi:hypothetical protein